MLSSNKGRVGRAIASVQAGIVALKTISNVLTTPPPVKPDISRSREVETVHVAVRSTEVQSPLQLSREAARWQHVRQKVERRSAIQRGLELKAPIAREERSRQKRSR